jgi:hypothetical protein
MIDENEGAKTPFTLALNGGMYIAIIIDQNEGHPNSAYNSLAWRQVFNHYNRPE